MKKWEFAVLVGFFAIFLILFFSVKPPWEAEASKPFDLDTDHDGVRDSIDSDPYNPGILIDSKQKIERSDLYNTDIGIPKGSTTKYYKITGAGYALRSYENYEINANYSQVLDFFLENMIRDGWRIRREADEIEGDYGLSGMSMYYSKEGEGEPAYVTIVVIGQDQKWGEPYTQFTIIKLIID